MVIVYSYNGDICGSGWTRQEQREDTVSVYGRFPKVRYKCLNMESANDKTTSLVSLDNCKVIGVCSMDTHSPCARVSGQTAVLLSFHLYGPLNELFHVCGNGV